MTALLPSAAAAAHSVQSSISGWKSPVTPVHEALTKIFVPQLNNAASLLCVASNWW
ncbi:hypothetical protein L7F22_000011, partial [Adiantum nelumboides]|nr:hypothetical protein [Adiantum nelumboides]